MGEDHDPPIQECVEIVVDRHRSFGRQMAIVAGLTAAGERIQVLFQDAPGRCSTEDLEALKRQLPTSRALALGKKDFSISCSIVAKESNKDTGGPPVFQAGKLLSVSSRSRGYLELSDKDQRHAIFADFVALELLPKGIGDSYVLEVAGGKGALATALGSRGMKVLMVDPRPPDTSADIDDVDVLDDPDQIEDSQEGEDEHHGAGSVRRLCRSFDDSSMALVSGAEAVVAMHPDEATDAVVEAALKTQRPFAVVPCCVFPRIFHQRRLRNGGGVVGYTGLIRFLREKDPRIRAVRLPFTGRNIVLYMTKKDFCTEKQAMDIGPLRALDWVPNVR